jgi:hypothetical protein
MKKSMMMMMVIKLWMQATMKIWVNRKHYDFKYTTFNPIDLKQVSAGASETGGGTFLVKGPKCL